MIHWKIKYLNQFLIISLCFAIAACAGRKTNEENQLTGAETTPNQANSAEKGAESTPNTGGKTDVSTHAKKPPEGAGSEASAEYHFSLAQAYVAEGNPDRAIEEYRLVLYYDPKAPLVHARLATEYIKKGMVAEAMETCKSALKLDPKYIDVKLILAGLYSMTKANEMALKEYGDVLKFNPKHEEAVIYKAQTLLEEHREKEAVATLRTFLRANAESALVWYYFARAQHQLKAYDDATVAYRKAMALKPGFAQAGLGLGYLYEERNMNPSAVKIYEEAYSENPDVSIAGRLATIYLKDEQYHKALPYLQAVAGQDADDMNTRVKLGLVQMELKKFDQATKTFNEILSKNPESDRVRFYLGSLYEETKNAELAMENFLQIPPQSKLYTEAILHAGYLKKDKQDFDGAKSIVRDAIKKSPNTNNFYLFLANLEEETKNLPEATKVLEQAVERFSEDEKTRYYLGSLYDRQGKVDKGLQQMEEILKINPENVDAMNYMAYTWTIQGVRFSDAEKLLKRALALKPDNGYVQDSWGWYLFTRGRVSEAVVELEKAVKMKPHEATILEHLADAYLKSNLREKAMAKYKKAVELTEEAEHKEKLTAKIKVIETEFASSGKGTGANSNRLPAQEND